MNCYYNISVYRIICRLSIAIIKYQKPDQKRMLLIRLCNCKILLPLN
ncbi:hypothetical protein CLOSYM_00477 [[Clostridium] symbiosum ATCC 14940]|uniref:Uncharacterized protein n=1 Tax=[Clostridium] symbiosum ATCC 14940 TaxID=411472 RepID=A0ABC9U2W1_CLOSY|nr:hypothetical protein CLOSYM_00477 [[Clostridium] symbiosum ATCC 14940]